MKTIQTELPEQLYKKAMTRPIIHLDELDCLDLLKDFQEIWKIIISKL